MACGVQAVDWVKGVAFEHTVTVFDGEASEETPFDLTGVSLRVETEEAGTVATLPEAAVVTDAAAGQYLLTLPESRATSTIVRVIGEMASALEFPVTLLEIYRR